jgi:prepilin-type N-terminal cleavage/methylation domain-containing protein/prepilin-type processing-associated H-X9-DG protein
MTNSRIQRMASKTFVRTAFTLIEVLVVVAIIALLVSILIPSLTEARDQARSARCLANMQDLGKGTFTFATTHRDRFQILYNISPLANPPELVEIGDTARTLFAYESGGVAFPNILSWPAVLARESGAGRSLKKNADWGIPGSIEAQAGKSTLRKFEQLSCPGDKVEIGAPSAPASPTPPPSGAQNWYWGYLSYAANTDILGFRPKDPTTHLPVGAGVWKDGVQGLDGAAGADPLGGRLNKVIRPADVVLYADGGVSQEQLATQPKHGGIHSGLGTSKGGGTIPRGPTLEYVDTAYKGRLRHERHRRNTINITFADGHGGLVRRFSGNPANPTSVETSTGPYALLPVWTYVPKTRVTPYNMGKYPSP